MINYRAHLNFAFGISKITCLGIRTPQMVFALIKLYALYAVRIFEGFNQ